MDKTQALFGLKNSNRNFAEKDYWGKNQFNSSFPASLCCYMREKGLNANYIKMGSDKSVISSIPFHKVFGVSKNNNSLFFSFETKFDRYEKYLITKVPNTDLVIYDKPKKNQVRNLEVKLTALPDNTTAEECDSKFGCEIVVRPDTILYLVCSVIEQFKNAEIEDEIKSFSNQYVWSKSNCSKDYTKMSEILLKISKNISNEPFLLQPIWKTEGKSSSLSENCLDVFVWSSAAFLFFIVDVAKEMNNLKISRLNRTVIWILKMLSDYFMNAKFNYEVIFDELSFNTRNDKAFAVSGMTSHKYMKCENLTKPRIKKTEIKKIILNDGQDFLSPERRLDAIISNDPSIF